MSIPTCLHTGGLDINSDWNNKSRMNREVHVRFCERLGLKCPCLLDNPFAWCFVLLHLAFSVFTASSKSKRLSGFFLTLS